MERVVSQSPPTSDHVIVRSFPLAESETILESSSYGRVTLQKRGPGMTKDDERDDAYGSHKMMEGERWNSDPKRHLPIHESGPAPGTLERIRMGKYRGESRQSEGRRHFPPSDWYRRHARPSPRAAYRMTDDHRHVVGMVTVSRDDGVPSVSPPHHSGPSTHGHGAEV